MYGVKVYVFGLSRISTSLSCKKQAQYGDGSFLLLSFVIAHKRMITYGF